MNVHILKEWKEGFQAVKSGLKKFEVRKNDRGFKQDDVLVLREYDPKAKKYSGDVVAVVVDYIMQGKFGLPRNLCVMGISIR